MTYEYNAPRYSYPIRKLADYIEWKRKGYEEPKSAMQPMDVRRERMRWSEKEEITGEKTWRKYTTEPQRDRTEAIMGTPMKAPPLVSPMGIRWKAGVTVLICLGAVLGMILLSEVAEIGNSRSRIRITDRKIEAASQSNAQFSTRLKEEANDANVCIEAAGLNLIPSSAVRIIRLSVPNDVNMVVSAAKTGNADIH